MYPKENVKYFNQIFLTLMNKIPNDSRPIDSSLIEFYTNSLPPSIVTFVNKDGKTTINQTFDVTLDIDKEIMSIEGKPTIEDKMCAQPFLENFLQILMRKKEIKKKKIWIVYLE